MNRITRCALCLALGTWAGLATGCGDDSDPAAPEVFPSVDAPSSVEAVLANPSAVEVRFSSVDVTDRTVLYQVFVATEPEPVEPIDSDRVSELYHQNLDPVLISTRHSGLEPARTHYVRVRARPDGGEWTEWSAVDSVITPTRIVDPDVPLGWGFDLDASGQHLAHELNGEIWINVLGTERVWRLAQGHTPTWSPDARRIAYVVRESFRNLIYQIDSAGGSPMFLGRIPGSDPDWSPDGNTLVLASGEGPVFLPLTSSQSETVDAPTAGSWSWAPDSDRVVGAASHDQPELTVVTRSTATAETFAVPVVGSIDAPVWSPHDERIVFDVFGDDEGLWVWELGAERATRLIGAGAYPIWSSDGRRILFYYGELLWSLPIDEVSR